MPNLDPQLAAEFEALERLRLAVLQYREEVIDLRKSHGLSALADIPRIELELPPEFQALLSAAQQTSPEIVALPEVSVPAPVAPPVLTTPVSPAATAAPVRAPATEPAEQSTDTVEERVRTAPFAPITSPNQIYTQPARAEAPAPPEPGLSMRAAPSAPPPEITEIKAAAATPVPMTSRAEARTPTPAAFPAIPNRRPGMSQSMQTETVGSFLRRFRLAAE